LDTQRASSFSAVWWTLPRASIKFSGLFFACL
jgi:hypothetical protein